MIEIKFEDKEYLLMFNEKLIISTKNINRILRETKNILENIDINVKRGMIK
ncbi:hypothetical protein KAI04_03925 [Candidatus Pacearchaeota archaeon]|nr:hypothetical protein [Candidatus Pacearchaeota archaeon]